MAQPFDPFGSGPSMPGTAGPRNEHSSQPVGPEMPPAASGALNVAGPPVALISAAALIAAAGLVVGLLFWEQWPAVIGWVLSGPVAIGLMAAYFRTDTARRTEAIYLQPGWITPFHGLVALLSASGIAVCAWSCAVWAGRL